MVRAKFKVASIKLTEGRRDVKDANGDKIRDEKGYIRQEACEMVSIEAHAVYANGDPNHENTKFWDASPSGKFELNVINPAAAKVFKVGQEFYLDITPITPA
jgi:hypothetical protein